MIDKSKEYSKNIKALNDKNIKKPKVKSTNESKAELESNQSVDSSIHNNKYNKVSSVKMRKNYEESLTQNRNILIYKKSNANLNKNVNKIIVNKNLNKNNNEENLNFINNNNLVSEITKSNLLKKKSLDSNSKKNLGKKANFSKSTCDLKHEIYLNVNKDSVFSLKPDEALNISENEFISNKESIKNENYKESFENLLSLDKNKTPSEKKTTILIKGSSINKISENINYYANEGQFSKKNNKFTLLANCNKNNESYFNNAIYDNKRFSSRSKSLAEFNNIKIYDKSVGYGAYGNNQKMKGDLDKRNKYKNTDDDFFEKINDKNKSKIEIITSNLNKNTSNSEILINFLNFVLKLK